MNKSKLLILFIEVAGLLSIINILVMVIKWTMK